MIVTEKQNTELTFRGYAPTVHLAESERTISGVITMFGVVAKSHGLLIEEGALEPRTPLSRVKLLRDHDHTDPVGYMLTISGDRTETTKDPAPSQSQVRGLHPPVGQEEDIHD